MTALTRYGELQCYSEVALLKWSNILWDTDRFTVTSLKTNEMARQREWSCGNRLFQNLCANRETELVNDFPIHVATEWLGNTPVVATKHYLQVTDDHFAQAVGATLSTVSG